MNKDERILDLLAIFLEARGPLSFRALRSVFAEEYGQGSLVADLRKFERDKAQLSELGLVLRFVEGEDGGYVLDGQTAFLPEVSLSKESWQWLYAAGAAALGLEVFPGREDLAHGLRKIAVWGEAPMPARAIDFGVSLGSQSLADVSAHLETLWRAIGQLKAVTIEYHSPHSGVTNRQIHPYGLCLRRGVWHCVAFCTTRSALRTFLVNRMRAVIINQRSPKKPDFEIPVGFRVGEYVPRWPWQQHVHSPITVTLSLKGSLATRAQQLFGAASSKQEGPETLVEVQATDVDALCRSVLAAGEQATVLGPPEARARLRSMAEAVFVQHGGVS